MNYTHLEHRHRFAVWTAARATQRHFLGGTSEAIARVMAKSELRKYVATPDLHSNITADRYDALHKDWCNDLIKRFKDSEELTISFGRAAKLAAIYIKSMVILGPSSSETLVLHAHPPIDGQVLKGLSKDATLPPRSRSRYRATTWTKLDQQGYTALIAQLRLDFPGEPMWTIERYWGDLRSNAAD